LRSPLSRGAGTVGLGRVCDRPPITRYQPPAVSTSPVLVDDEAHPSRAERARCARHRRRAVNACVRNVRVDTSRRPCGVSARRVGLTGVGDGTPVPRDEAPPPSTATIDVDDESRLRAHPLTALRECRCTASEEIGRNESMPSRARRARSEPAAPHEPLDSSNISYFVPCDPPSRRAWAGSSGATARTAKLERA
jgi:hypothetical protein